MAQPQKERSSRHPFQIRIISRVTGRLLFGSSNDEDSWRKTYAEAVQKAKEKASLAEESLDNLQVHIKNNKKGEVRFNDQAKEL